jgi:hypothetical protein
MFIILQGYRGDHVCGGTDSGFPLRKRDSKFRPLEGSCWVCGEVAALDEAWESDSLCGRFMLKLEEKNLLRKVS